MSINSIPYLSAEAITAQVISAASTDADKLARAEKAATIAAFFTAIGKGDVAAANQQIATAISNLKDPGQQKFVNDLWSAAQPFLQVQLNVTENVPILGGSVSSALQDVGAGMASVAGAYISQLSAKKAGG